MEVATKKYACENDPNPDAWFAGRMLNGFFPNPEWARAKALCGECPFVTQCRDYARAAGVPSGMWGGEDEWARAEWWAENGGRPKFFEESYLREIEDLLYERDCAEGKVTETWMHDPRNPRVVLINETEINYWRKDEG